MLVSLAIAAAALVLDQLTKYWAQTSLQAAGDIPLWDGVFHFHYARNTGAAFSMLEGKRTFFLILTAVFLLGVVYCAVKKIFSRPYLWIFTVIAGGAIGNLIDRVVNGYVVDMIALDFMNFAVFNVADLFVTGGAAALAIYALFLDRKGRPEPEAKQ